MKRNNGLRRYLLIFLKGISLVLLLLSIAGCGNSNTTTTEGEDCDDHELPYEWSGEYSFKPGTYTMIFEESGDPTCAVAFMFLDDVPDEIAHMAIHVMEAEMDTIAPEGHFLALPEFGYILSLNPEGTTFSFEIGEGGTYVIFTEHAAHEFNLKIIDPQGLELEVLNETEYEGHHHH